jgi:hypothetical protein
MELVPLGPLQALCETSCLSDLTELRTQIQEPEMSFWLLDSVAYFGNESYESVKV